MSDSDIGRIIKDGLINLDEREKHKGHSCPSDEELADYIEGVMAGNRQKGGIAGHVVECDFCFSKVASGLSALAGFKKDKVKQKAKTKKSYIKRNIYLFIGAGFFILSFIMKRYFIQFLTAASIFGLKWVMDTGSSRALIMVYDAWRRKNSREATEGRKELFKR